MISEPGYAIVTTLRDESDTLPDLAASVAEQEALPETWVLVDNGSTDATPEVARRLAAAHTWIRVVDAPAAPDAERARPIVRAFEAGVSSLSSAPSVVAKVDADVTLPADYFRRLLEELERDPRLGIVSGACLEREGGEWRPRFGTGTSVWGAARAYRWECLAELLPLEQRTAWDWIDVAEANLRGWRTAVVRDLPFYHHRREGGRARTRWAQWSAQGRAAHYLGYRPTYLVARALFRSLRDPAAVALVTSFAGAALRGDERCRKPALVARVRHEQRLRNLARRAAEARGAVDG